MKTIADEQGKLTNDAAGNYAAFDVIDLGPFDNNRNDLKASPFFPSIIPLKTTLPALLPG